MQIKSVAILANPIAGSGKATKIANQLQQFLAYKNIANTVYTRHWPTNDLLTEFSD